MDIISSQLIIKEMLKGINNGRKEVFQIFWDNLLSIISTNWPLILIILLLLLIVSFIIALSGRWAMFGSVLYYYLYCGILFILGLIFGPKIFINIFIDLILFILYLTCYQIVGRVLTKLHLKK